MTPLRKLASLVVLSGGLGNAAASPPATNSIDAAWPTLELLQTIEIPPESATVRLQYGHLVARNGVQEQDAFCVFEIDTRADRAQRLDPERFFITRISRSVESFAAHAGQPTRVALWMDEDLPSQIYYKTTLRLRSERQPTVRSLSCMSNQMMPGTYLNMRHLSLAEMRAALGGYFRLEPIGDTAF